MFGKVLTVFGFVTAMSVSALADDTLSVEEIMGSLKASADTEASEVSVEDVIGGLKAQIAVVQRNPTNPNAILNTSELDRRSQIDMEILFASNSSLIEQGSFQSLISLGQAMTSTDLANSKFILAGHTDGVGSVDANLTLSEKRAVAVQSFLIAAFPSLSENLYPIGFGEQKLKNAQQPDDGSNRRVQIINMGGTK